MADRSRKPSSRKSTGRTTPKGTPPAGREKPPRPGIDQPAQVGRRPSSPVFLFVLSLVWIACGVGALFGLDASWRYVPAIFFAGVGVYFLRGAAVTVVRREGRGSPD